MKYVKKYWFITLIIVIGITRFLFSYKLPSIFFRNLKYDDLLINHQVLELMNGNYLGDYSIYTLVKGNIFSLVLYYATLLKVSYSTFLTLLYVFSCTYLLFSIKELIKNKWFLIVIYIVLLFNPVSYSGELFQRLYINTISITELMIFIGALINIITSKEEGIINYVILGTISALMILTRNDNIWIYIILSLLAIYKLLHNFNIRRLISISIPFFIILLGLHITSFVNYKHYNIYTYNELENSNFKRAYEKIIEIKDDEDIERVSIPRSTFYKLCDYSKVFEYTREEIDNSYRKSINTPDGEIDNGNIIWFLRAVIYTKYDFKDGKEADDYFFLLSEDIERLFKEGILERDSSILNTYINVPKWKELKRIPGSLINAIWYTTSYKNVKTYSKYQLEHLDSTFYDGYSRAYSIVYDDYRHAEEIINHNPLRYEIIRIIYKYSTIILSVISIILYIKNIKKKDKLNILLHTILLIYIIIICGVVYTNVTAFFAIRYRYLANIYILQSLFILLNMYRLIEKSGDGHDISNSTSLQRRKIS